MKPATCTFTGCNRKHYSKGLCHSHRMQQRAGKELTPVAERLKLKGTTCTLSGCLRPAKAKGFCAHHHKRKRRAEEWGTVELGDWKGPIRAWRPDTTLMRVRVPKKRELALQRFANLRGLSAADALVELAMKALEERLGVRAA